MIEISSENRDFLIIFFTKNSKNPAEATLEEETVVLVMK
jgi:hypothetical protein